MGGVLKRQAPAAAVNGVKTQKRVKIAVSEPDSASEGSEQLSGDGEDSETDSEVNEFEVDDDLIGDDDEDLHAGLDDDALSEDDEELDSEEGEANSDEEEEATPAAPLALKKSNVRNSRGAPTLKPEELRALAFAELTASPISSILSSSVATLLSPITPPAPATSPLQPLLKELHSHIIALADVKPKSLKGLKKKGTVVPPVEGLDGKWGDMDLAWEKPRAEDVRIVGKWAWSGGIKVKGEYHVDMAIAMPETLLQPKDFMAPRFLIKSTHYLVTLSSRLPAVLGPTTLSYVPLADSQGYALEVRATPPVAGMDKSGLGKSKGAVLRLRVVWPTDAFPLNKLSPLSNLSRPPSTPGDEASTFPATPRRATGTQFSSLPLLTSHLKFHHSLVTTHGPSYTSAVRLLQAWAAKRSYLADMGFSMEWWAWCVARTLAWGSASGEMGNGTTDGGAAWAVWRKAVEWLAGVKWEEGVWFRVEGSNAYPKEDFRKAFAGHAIFGDPTGTVNLAAGIDLATLNMLKQDAKTTIALLLSGVDDETKFESAFLRDIRSSERFDNYARVTIPTSALSAEESLDHSAKTDSLIASLSTTLTRALGTRITAFQLSRSSPPPLVHTGPSPEAEPIVLSLGLLLDPVQSGRFVDQGPSAEDEAACVEFRSFWGSKSELRRFKDGSILESVVWEEESQGSSLGPQRNKVISHILKHILSHRHGIPSANVEVFAGAMDHLLVEPEGVRRAIFLEDSVATGKGFSTVVAAFDALSKELKDLPDLPLAVSGVHPTGPGLRYSTVFTPSPRRLKQFERFPESVKYVEAHDIQLTLEGSGRWPEDLVGVQKIKAAFLARIAEGLSELHTIVEAKVVLDTDAREVDDNVSLEILTATGFAFRARIFYDRSQSLLVERERQLEGSSTVGPSSLSLFTKRFHHLPRHHAAISTLQHSFTAYSPTVRLVKRWFSTHMLLSSFPHELLELVSASVFIDPSSPYEPPQSGAAGFARVMALLASWKWRDAPLFVPLYTFSTATSSGRRAVFPPHLAGQATAALETERLRNPAIDAWAWIVATEQDGEGLVWGRSTEKVAAARAKSLAKATLKAMDAGVSAGNLVVESLFAPPLDDYHFLLHLDASKIPRHFQALAPDSKALSSSRSSSDVVAGSIPGSIDGDQGVLIEWDPVKEFLTAIESLYPSTFALFYADGSSVVGGVWNPSAEPERQWKVGIGFPCTPCAVKGDEKAKVVLDKQAVLREVQRLGKGLVKRVELR